uniref:FAD-dependent oxidoreductase domain-containing protein 1 n=1 Tax=Trichuris muris TaxID=70415 RepID=A0A5S6Q8E8_TRIMR
MAKTFLCGFDVASTLFSHKGSLKCGACCATWLGATKRSYHKVDSNIRRYDAENLRDFPNKVDVLVIGGGLSGLSVAYFLSATSNAQVLVLERGRLGEEIALHRSGFMAANHLWQNYALPEIASVSLEIYSSLFGDHKTADLRPLSRLLLGFTEATVMQLQRVHSFVKAYGIEAKMLTADEVRSLYQGPNFGDLKEALVVSEYKVNQLAAIHAFAEAASRAGWNSFCLLAVCLTVMRFFFLGVRILENCPVKSFKTVGHHCIDSVETDYGFVKCDVLVDAAGACAGDLLPPNANHLFKKLPVHPFMYNYLVLEGSPSFAQTCTGIAVC